MKEKFACFSHPRLFYGKEDLINFRRELTRNEVMKQQFDAFEEREARLLDTEFYSEEYANSVYSQHGRYYELGDQLEAYGETLGFLYQVTGNRQYAEKIKKALFHYASFEAWTGPANKDRPIPWHSDLSTTRMAYGFAMGIDTIDETLTEAEREELTAALYHKGIRPLLADWVLPESRIHALDSMGHNWWAVCIGLASVALTAIYERIPEGREYLDACAEALEEFTEYQGNPIFNKVPNFDKNGMFYESAGYFNYGAGEWMRAAFVRKRCLGDSSLAKNRTMKQAGDVSGLMIYDPPAPGDDYLAANFGDSSLDTSSCLLYRFLLLCGTGGNREAMVSYYHQMQKRQTPLDFIYHNALHPEKTADPLQKETFCCLENYLFLRSPERNGGTLFAARCGATWNHAHEDAGSFLLFDRGEPLLIDSGAAPSYSDPTYLEYYVRSRAHNIMLVGNGKRYREDIFRGTHFPGSFPISYRDQRISYALADVTGPTGSLCDRNYRSFLKIDEETFLILDDIHTYGPESFAFLLHYQGHIREEGPDIYVENQVSSAAIRFFSDKQLSCQKQSGYQEAKKEEPPVSREYLSAAFRQETDTCLLITLIRLNQENEKQQISVSFDDNKATLTRIRNGRKTVVCINRTADGSELHMNSIIELNGLETDAYVFILWEETEQRGYTIINGSFLRDKKKVYYSKRKKGQASGYFSADDQTDSQNRG